MSTRYYIDLEIIGDDAQIASALEYLKGEPDENGLYMHIDFNNFVKMPEELKNHLYDIPSNYLYKPIDEEEDSYSYLIDDSMDEKNIPSLQLGIEKNSYGHSDDSVGEKDKNVFSEELDKSDFIGKRNAWCYENWGCKYNPVDQEIIEDNIISFTLINGTGFSLIQKLSEIFNKVVFIYLIICENPDEDEIYTIKDGKILKYYEYDYFVKAIIKGEIYCCSSKIESRIYNFIKTNYKSK